VTEHTDTPPPLMTGRYVALGSSMAAGPGIRPRAPGAPWPAFRSARNYAHLVANALGLDLVDMTYTNATTANVLAETQHGAPPQIKRAGRFRVLDHRDDRRQRRGLCDQGDASIPTGVLQLAGTCPYQLAGNQMRAIGGDKGAVKRDRY
jgi:hypothetical protein